VLDSPEALAAALEGTALQGRSVEAFPVPNTDAVAFFVACEAAEVLEVWRAAMDARGAVGRYPVVTYAVDSFAGVLRGGYHPSQYASPLEIVERASVSGGRLLPEQSQQQGWDLRVTSVSDDLAYELPATMRVIGHAPDPNEVIAALGEQATIRDLARWLLDWELEHGDPASSSEVRSNIGLATFDPRTDPGFPYFVCFLPTAVSWHVPAYVDYFGAEGREVEFCVAAREWESAYGARFLCLGAVTADLAVARPPATSDEAWALAAQQIMFGGSYQGRYRWLALSLRAANEWHLFDRP
jgi:hypothetical protein